MVRATSWLLYKPLHLFINCEIPCREALHAPKSPVCLGVNDMIKRRIPLLLPLALILVAASVAAAHADETLPTLVKRVKPAVVAIATDLLPFSTGEVIDVDGGFHLRRL